MKENGCKNKWSWTHRDGDCDWSTLLNAGRWTLKFIVHCLSKQNVYLKKFFKETFLEQDSCLPIEIWRLKREGDLPAVVELVSHQAEAKLRALSPGQGLAGPLPTMGLRRAVPASLREAHLEFESEDQASGPPTRRAEISPLECPEPCCKIPNHCSSQSFITVFGK